MIRVGFSLSGYCLITSWNCKGNENKNITSWMHKGKKRERQSPCKNIRIKIFHICFSYLLAVRPNLLKWHRRDSTPRKGGTCSLLSVEGLHLSELQSLWLLLCGKPWGRNKDLLRNDIKMLRLSWRRKEARHEKSEARSATIPSNHSNYSFVT